jgi:hypothetical protein
MKSSIGPQLGSNRTAMLQQRNQAVNKVRTHGTSKLPLMARDAQVQPGAGGTLLTWKLPVNSENVTGYRVYLGTESNLHAQIRDRGTRQLFIPLSSGATPPVTNLFVSTINGFREGPRVHIQAQPLPDTTAPGPNPTPPTDWTNVFSGGLDKTQSGPPSGVRQQ